MSTDTSIASDAPGTLPAAQAVREPPAAVPCTSCVLANGWTLSVSGPTEAGEVWVTFRAPKPSGAFASHWVPADSVRGKVMLDLLRTMQADQLPEVITNAQHTGDVIGSAS